MLVIHENRGLNDHTATSPGAWRSPDTVRSRPTCCRPPAARRRTRTRRATRSASSMSARSAADAVALLAELAKSSRGGKVGAVGFCWGGAFVNRLAVAAGGTLAAAVPYYGPAPAPSEAPKVEAAMLIQHAGLDNRVAADRFPVGRRSARPASRSNTSSMTGSITPSTTTPRPSATTRQRPTSRGSGPCASSSGISAASRQPPVRRTVRLRRRAHLLTYVIKKIP